MGINRFGYIGSELGLYQSVGQTYGRVVGMVGRGHAHGYSGRRTNVSLETGQRLGGCIVIPCGYFASLPFLVSGAAVVWLLVL